MTTEKAPAGPVKGSTPTKPRTVPTGMKAAGKALWKEVTGTYSLAPGEMPLLALACRQADDVAALEALLAADGLVVAGSAGQLRLSAVVTELRQGRLALAKLLDQLALPVEAGAPSMTPAQRRGKAAADARWGQERAKEERRAALRGLS
jgi:hypothetical protein